MSDAPVRIAPNGAVFEGWVTGRDAGEQGFFLFDGRDEWDVRFAGTPCVDLGAAVRVEGDRSDRSIHASRVDVLAAAAQSPFDLLAQEDAAGATRSRFRYLEFRNPAFQQVFRLRHRIWLQVSQLLDSHGYIHVETPMLATPSESGAAEFTVASARDAGLRYALPQSPQLFGHLLAIGGVSRYFQWSRCFRDEDLRVNRQPEFTQLHLEAAFADEEQLMRLVGEVVRCCFALAGLECAPDFARLSYADAQRLYGSDKPDLRLACALTQLPCLLIDGTHENELMTCELPEGLVFTADEIAEIGNLAARRRMPVVGYLAPEAQHLRFPMRVDRAELAASVPFGETYAPGARLLLSGDWEARAKLSRDLYQWLSLRPERPQGAWRPVWICEFPLFEADAAEKGRLKAFSHPFTAPQDPAALAAATRNHELLALKGRAFDLVLNGEEIGSGSMLVGDPDLQHAIFGRLGLSKKQVRGMFGVLMDALACGAPPIGGFGLGVDRLIALLTGKDKIRDVIAFPKSRNGLCPVFQKR